MSDTLITVVAIFLTAILMFIFPLMSVAERGDDMSQLSVSTATSEFVNEVVKNGKCPRFQETSHVGVTAENRCCENKMEHHGSTTDIYFDIFCNSAFWCQMAAGLF